MTTTFLTVTKKVAAAVQAYYRLADSFTATIPDALAWYDTLPADVHRKIGILAPHEWLAFPDFKCYLLERNGIYLYTYLATHLTSRELNHWLMHETGAWEQWYAIPASSSAEA